MIIIDILVDVGRNQAIAQKFRLKLGAMSQQIPTMALMKDGECVEIRPEVLSTGKLRRFHFSEGKSYSIPSFDHFNESPDFE